MIPSISLPVALGHQGCARGGIGIRSLLHNFQNLAVDDTTHAIHIGAPLAFDFRGILSAAELQSNGRRRNDQHSDDGVRDFMPVCNQMFQ